MDEWDLVLGEERAMLLAAADIGVGEAGALAARFGGVAYPAHIDRASFSLLSVLGLWEPSLGFSLGGGIPPLLPGFRQRSDLSRRPPHHFLRRAQSGPGMDGGACHGPA